MGTVQPTPSYSSLISIQLLTAFTSVTLHDAMIWVLPGNKFGGEKPDNSVIEKPDLDI